jgi:hypothetical protein
LIVEWAIRVQRAVLLLMIAIPASLAHAQLQRLTYDNPREVRGAAAGTGRMSERIVASLMDHCDRLDASLLDETEALGLRWRERNATLADASHLLYKEFYAELMHSTELSDTQRRELMESLSATADVVANLLPQRVDSMPDAAAKVAECQRLIAVVDQGAVDISAEDQAVLDLLATYIH